MTVGSPKESSIEVNVNKYFTYDKLTLRQAIFQQTTHTQQSHHPQPLPILSPAVFHNFGQAAGS